MFSNPQTFILFLASGTLAVVGNFLMKSGINRLGNFNLDLTKLLETGLKMVSNWQIVVGFLLYGLSSILYLKLLTTAEVTKIYPSLVAYMAVVLLLLATIFLKESFSLPKILGTSVIILGIFLLNR